MNVAPEHLAQRLESALGANLVSLESAVLSAHAVDGKTPALVCFPVTPEQVAAILHICAEAKAAVSPRGGGTMISVGNAPRETCVAIALTAMNRVIEHDHANLTVTVQSGITLAVLRETLSRRQQFLPVDAPHPTRTTIGGAVAVNINGPRRGYYGGIRDLVIGMKVALISGEQIKAGGKVVKNVAGYDMCKLFTGSLGTLGVITEVTVRVAPIPETAATIIVSGNFDEVRQFVERLCQSPLLPAAVMLMNFQGQYRAGKSWQVAIWCDGLEEAVARHLADAETLARQLGLRTAIHRGSAHDEFWDEVRDLPLAAERCVYRATVPRAALGRFIEAVLQTTDSVPELIGDMVVGTVWLSFPAHRQAVAMWPQLISLGTAQHGHAVMFSAPHPLKEGLDVWGPPPSTFSLMREIKHRFDPHGLLNPGRFLAGI
jgi:glycolate oxidase FAD binding subunit